MATDKPSKLITKLLEQTKLDASKINALTSENMLVRNVNQGLAEKVQRLERELLEATVKAEKQAEHIAASSIEAGTALERSEAEHSVTKARLAKSLDKQVRQHDEIKSMQTIIEKLSSDIEEARKKLQDVEPQLALYEQQKAELSQLCDKVRDRMRRREKEQEQSILNRKAVTLGGGRTS